MRPVEVIRQGRKVVDPGGGVFVADKSRGLVAPVYGFGARGSKAVDPVFSCPTGIIKREWWELLELWWISKSLGALPRAGGVLDQPLAVLRSFPIFEQEHKKIESQAAANNQANGIASALVAVYGGGRS